MKKELSSISKQIEESKGEYINVHTNAINNENNKIISSSSVVLKILNL